MKTKLLIFSLLLTGSLTAQNEKYLNDSTCPFKLDEAKPLTNPVEEYSHPRISPDGNKVIVTKRAYTGIYIIDLENSGRITTVTNEPKVGFDAIWSKDGKEIKFKKYSTNNNGKLYREPLKYNFQFRSITPDNRDLKSANANLPLREQDISVNYNLKTRMVEATNGIKTWNITETSGEYFNCLLSPDNSMVLIHKNDGKMYVYALNGSGMINCIGRGICQNWSPDGKYLLYFIDHDDGHVTLDSDIHICSSDGTQKWKLTNTPDKIELWPHWSAKGDKIVYYEANSKRIFISNLIKRR